MSFKNHWDELKENTIKNEKIIVSGIHSFIINKTLKNNDILIHQCLNSDTLTKNDYPYIYFIFKNGFSIELHEYAKLKNIEKNNVYPFFEKYFSTFKKINEF